MKKIFLLINVLLIFAVLFNGCAQAGNPNPDLTEESVIESSSESTKATGATETTQSSAPPDYSLYKQYNIHPKTYFVLNYKAGKSGGDYVYPGKPFDTSGMIDGALYAIDDGAVYLLTEHYTTDICKTSEHIYYVLKEDPKKVWRTDHYGTNHTVIYESEYGNVTGLQYFGINENGKLIMAENYNRIIMYDIPSKNIDVLMEAYKLDQFYFSPDGKEFSRSEAMIFWKGLLNESDQEMRYENTYHYFIHKDEYLVLIDSKNWMPVKKIAN